MALLAHAGLAVAGLVHALETEIIEREQLVRGAENQIAAVAAVAAIGAASGHVRLTAERHAPVSAFARSNGDDRFVNEPHYCLRAALHAAKKEKGGQRLRTVRLG